MLCARLPAVKEKNNKYTCIYTCFLELIVVYCLQEENMPQISLYVDEITLKKVEYAAARQHKSLSKWVIEQLKTKVDPIYPTDYEDLFGSIDDPTFTRPTELSFTNDIKREVI